MANEKRLIDANALIGAIDEYMKNAYDCPLDEVADFQRSTNNTKQIYTVEGLYEATEIIDEAPTVDAVEVVHGYWHIDDYDSGEPDGYAAFIEVHCSECGYELGAESGQYGWAYGDPFPLKYCPNCGARMDLEVNDA